MNRLSEHPYRLLMPVGIVASWVGVGQWLLHVLGWLEDYRPVLHAFAQTEGFLTSFVAAFLLTMLPRRSGTARPSPGLVLLLTLLIILLLGFAALDQTAFSQSMWLLLLCTLLIFVLRRTLRATRPLPDTFVWLPVAFGFGIAGGVMAAIGGAIGGDWWWLHQVGRGLGLQGFLLGVVVGVGRLVFSVMLHGEGSSGVLPRAVHGLMMAALGSTFFVEVLLSPRAGYLARALIVGAILWTSGELYRRPSKQGLNRWAIWIAGWAIPIGYLLSGIWTAHWRAGLHLTLVAGLSYLVLSVGAQVQLGHGGHEELKNGRPWWMFVFAFGIVVAVIARALMEFDPNRFFLWMGVASTSYVGVTALWMVVIALRPPRRAESS